MLAITRENLKGVLTEEDEFSLKIMADRYLLKDVEKKPSANDPVLVELDVVDEEGNIQYDAEGHKRTVKEVAIVDEVKGKEAMITLFTGERGKTFTVGIDRIDVLLEKGINDIKRRISKALSGGSTTLRKEIHNRLMDQIILGGRILAGAGTDEELTYFNCYVSPFIHDSRGGLADHRKIVMEIMSRGGGVGTNGSTLRPSKTKVHKVRGRSSGAVSWLDDLSRLTHLVEQGGSRRGAQMIALADFHPDLIEFITAKAQKPLQATIRVDGEERTIKFGKHGNQRLTGANISVLISDKFMDAYYNDEDWELVFPDVANYTEEQMELYDRTWHKIADPWEFEKQTGLSLKVHATIPARDIVHLISVAMHGSAEPGVLFIERANKFSNTWYFNPLICTNPCGEQFLAAWSVCNLGYINLAKHVYWKEKEKRFAVDFEELKKSVRVLVRTLDNVIDATPYYFDENHRQQLNERRLGLGTMGIDELLKLRGYDYGTKEGRKMAEMVFSTITLEAYRESVELAKEKGAFPMFDADKFLQSGFMKFIASQDEKLVDDIRKHGIRNATIITQAPTGTTGTMAQTSTGIEPFFAGTFFRSSRIGYTQQTAPVIKRMQEKGVGTDKLKYAGDYTPKQHLDFQAVAQRWCDSSISKTINAPSSTTVDDVAGLIEYAYKNSLKGFTVYVDGSREGQVLSTTNDKTDELVFKAFDKYPVKSTLASATVGVDMEEGNLKQIVIDIERLSPVLNEKDVEKHLKHLLGTAINAHFSTDCSQCGAPLRLVEGCFKCEACGFSKCG